MNGIVHLKYASYEAKSSLKGRDTVLAVNKQHFHHKLDQIDYLRDSINEFEKINFKACE